MRTPADDVQMARHNFGQMAEHLAILRDALQAEGFTGPLHDQLIIEWWKTTIAPQPPDPGELLKIIMEQGDQ